MEGVDHCSYLKKGDKTDCGKRSGVSRVSSTYKILSNILLSKLTPYAEEIIGDHHCGFRYNRSAADRIFCIRQILEEKWEYNKVVHQLFTHFKKAYDTFRKEVLCNILIEAGIPLKLVRLIKLCLNETYGRVQAGKYLSDMFPLRMV